MLNALALRCRDPGEFIASVVEHHRGFPLPRNEEEKTYLVFIGVEDEEDILEHIPGPGEDFIEAQRWQDDDSDDKVEGYEEREGRYQEMDEDNEVEADGPELPAERARGIPRRIRIRWVEAEGPNEDTGGTYGAEGIYRECNNNGDNQSSSEAGEYGEFAEKPLPSVTTQQGRMAEGSMANELRLEPNTAHGYHADGEEGTTGEAVGEDLVRRFFRLPSNLDDGDGGMLDGVDGEFGFDKHSPGQEFDNQFSQFHSLQGECDSGLDDDRVEGRQNQTINDSQVDSDEIVQESRENEPECLINNNEKIELPTPNDKSNQTFYLPKAMSQIIEPSSLALKLRGEISPTSSPLSSPPPEPEHEKVIPEPVMGEKGQEISDELQREEEGYTINHICAEEKPNEAVCGEREGSVELHGVEEQGRHHTANKISLQAPSRCRLVLQTRKPKSPTRPHSNEISPLASHPNASLINVDENNPVVGNRYPAEAGEDETPIYPIPTLENLVATENVDIIYLPDLETLHGFLEFIKSSPVTSTLNPPLLAIWGLVSAHYETEYYGGVGIGLTVARAVEAAARSGRLLVLGEGYIGVDYDDGEEEVQECWMDIEVPILNMGSMIAGKTVEIGQVLKRWCRFAEDLDFEDEGEGDGEGDGEEGKVGEYDDSEEGDEGEEGSENDEDGANGPEREDEAEAKGWYT